VHNTVSTIVSKFKNQVAMARMQEIIKDVKGALGLCAERLIDMLRKADNTTLANCACGAGLAMLFLSHRRKLISRKETQCPLPLPTSRHRQFLAKSTVDSLSSAGADTIVEHGVKFSDRVLIAARSIEAVEMSAWCSLVCAEYFLINFDKKTFEESAAVTLALQVDPALFVYDTDVIAPSSALAICNALKNKGCRCTMVSVSEKVETSHAQYNVMFSNAIKPLPLPLSTAGPNTSTAAVGAEEQQMQTLWEKEVEVEVQMLSGKLAEATADSAGKRMSKSNGASGIFEEMGSALVGFLLPHENKENARKNTASGAAVNTDTCLL
jgi:hypothetical protein